MQSEIEANAIAWGLSDFNKSSIKVLKSKDLVLLNQETESQLLECPLTDTTIFSRGTCYEIGVEVAPSSSWTKSLDDFIRSWENQSIFLRFDLQIKCDEKIVPRETSSVQKLQLKSPIVLDKKIIKRTKNGLFIGTITSLRVPPQYLDMTLSLILQLSVVVPGSKIPSNYRHGMSLEEQEVRALLETGRYHPPYVAPREIALPIQIIESLSVQCWSRNIDPWTCLSCIELKNTHPFKDILVRHIGMNLNASLRVEAIDSATDANSSDSAPISSLPRPGNLTPGGNSLIPPLQFTSTNISLLNQERNKQPRVMLLPCSIPLEPWFNVVDLSHSISSPTPRSSSTPLNPQLSNHDFISIRKGESYSLVYKISPRHVVNDTSSSTSSTPLSTSGIPPTVLSGHFLTPLDVWWIECPETKDIFHPETNLNESTLPSTFLSLYTENDCLVSTASLCWGIEKIYGREFAVEIDGPLSIHPLHPVELQLRISNLTSDTKNIVLYLQQPKEAHIFDAPPPTILLNSEYHTQQQSQWKNSGVVNHDITVPIRELQPGRAVSISIYLFPLRQGIVEFSDLHVLDELTKEVSKLKSPYRLLVQ